MPLVRKFTEPGASVNYVQVGHRQTAVEYAIAGIRRQKDANLKEFSGDEVFSELETTMGEWVIETLLQGAYMREYHLWEKDCKAYFGQLPKSEGKSNSIVERVRKVFSNHQFELPEDIFSAIDEMRGMVNIMKHEEGLALDHFISETDYKAGVAAIEAFWEYLVPLETVDYRK